MNQEKEILTILSEEEYKDVDKYLRSKLGEAKIQKRLSLQSDNCNQVDIDTRIRITNGKAELMQKIGDWKNITSGKARTEISIPIQNDAIIISSLYKILRNLVQGSNVQNIVMQYESYLWKKKEFEIKLTHQYGKNDAYNCEVEVFNHSLMPEAVANKYSIPIHLPTQTQNFWRKWNKKVNLYASDLPDKKLSEIIEVLNERFGTEFEEADKLFFEQIEAELIQDEKLQTQAKANKIDTFKYAFEDMFLNKLIERMDQNQDIFDKIIENKSFGNLVKELMLKKVYNKINEEAIP